MNLDQSLKAIEQAPISRSANPKLIELWEKIRPMVVMLGLIFGKKVKPYINAFVAAIDEITAEQEADPFGAKKSAKRRR